MPKRKNLIRVLIAFVAVIVVLGFFVAGVFQQNYVVPILMYHSVDPDEKNCNMITVNPLTFQRQMNFLKKHRYNVLPLETLVSLIKEKRRIPPRAVAITFDDGYKNVFTHAFPALKKYNLPATAFVIVQEIGRPDRLSWDEVKIMQGSGLITIGSHCLGPEPLVKIKSDEEVKNQIFDSKRILEEKLAGKVNFFSYPEGMFNTEIRKLVIDAGYLGAVGTNPGRDYPDDDIFVLKRLRISENARNMFVFAVETSGFYTFMKENKRKHKK